MGALHDDSEEGRDRFARFAVGLCVSTFAIGGASAVPAWLAGQAHRWTEVGLPPWSPWAFGLVLVAYLCWKLRSVLLVGWEALERSLLASSLAFGLLLGAILQKSLDPSTIYVGAAIVAALGFGGLLAGAIWGWAGREP